MYSLRISKNTLKFSNIKVNKKQLHDFKQPVPLDLVDINQIITSEKFKLSGKGSKHFIGYKGGDIIRHLSIFLHQISGYINILKWWKNMSFVIKNDSVLVKCNDIWNKI